MRRALQQRKVNAGLACAAGRGMLAEATLEAALRRW
jgi:hypothetical protein